MSQGEQSVSSSIVFYSFSSKQLESPGSSAMSGYTPEARNGYFCPINVEYECLSLWTNQNKEQ